MSFTLYHQSTTAKFTSDLWHQTSIKLTLCYQNAACHGQSLLAFISTSWHELRYHEIYFFALPFLSFSAQLAWPRQQREGNLFRAEEKTTFQIDLLKHLHSQLCRNFNMTWRTFGWNFAHIPSTAHGLAHHRTQLGMLHYTQIAVYSCPVLVSTMSSPTECSGTISTERNCLIWVRALQLERGWRCAMKPYISTSLKGHIVASPALLDLVEVTVSRSLWM